MGHLTFLEGLMLLAWPLGQVYIRAFSFAGSLDKPWLLVPIFGMPPLSLVTLFIFWFGGISDGPGGEAIDWWITIPMVSYTLASILIRRGSFLKFGVKKELILCAICCISSMITFAVRDFIQCRKNGNSYNFFQSICDGIIATGFLYGFALVWAALAFVPVLGEGIEVINMIPVIGPCVAGLFELFGYMNGYMIVNMCDFANSNFCTNWPGTFKYVLTFLSFIVILVGVFKKTFLFFL